MSVPLGDGTEVPCLMNLHAVGMWCREEGRKPTDLDTAMQEDPLDVLPRLTWAGVRTHHTLHGKELPMDFERYSILFGSSDWQPVAESVGQALALDSGAKKKGKTATGKR